jgi:hypothetical protein
VNIRNMQFVRMSMVLPDDVRQNMKTGLIPLNSVRFAVANTLPAQTDIMSWYVPLFFTPTCVHTINKFKNLMIFEQEEPLPVC